MHIAIDLSAVRTTGTLVYTQGFIPAFIELLSDQDCLTVFAPDILKNMLEPFTSARVQVLYQSIVIYVPARIVWQQIVLPRLLLKFGIDVLFEPFDMAPWFTRSRIVIGVRNPTPVLLATRIIRYSWHATLLRRLHQALVRKSCRGAETIIFPSAYAAVAAGDPLGIPLEKRKVVHHGLDLGFWTAGKGSDEDLPNAVRNQQPYILFASKLYVHKRATLLVDAFMQWRTKYNRTEYRLAFCGEDRADFNAPLQAQIDKAGLSDYIHLLGNVSRPILTALYLNAAAIALPTVMETFGFPYVEAMACQVPLVCADIDIARELCGDVPFYFAVDDRNALSEALEASVTDTPERRRKLAAGAQKAGKFSWQREAEETMACIRGIRRAADISARPVISSTSKAS